MMPFSHLEVFLESTICQERITMKTCSSAHIITLSVGDFSYGMIVS